MHEGSWQAWKVYHYEGVEDLKYPTLKKYLSVNLHHWRMQLSDSMYPCIGIIFKIKIDSYTKNKDADEKIKLT